MIRIRGLPVSDADAADLAERLHAQSEAGKDLAERVERALIAGMGMIATDRPQARALLAVLVERMDEERLTEIRESLGEFLAAKPALGS